jgi:hypothetical protein
MFAQGEIPLEPQDPEFVSESMHGDDQDDDNFDDEFDAENYDDLDFDEHWN